MNPITLNCVYADGTKVTATAAAPDFIAFEMKFDKSVQSFQNDVRVTYLFFLAWHALKRTNQTDVEFEAWVENVMGIDVDAPKASKA